MLKTATFTMRIRPEIKAALMELARIESRTASAELEALVKEKCKKLGVSVVHEKVAK